MAKKKPASGGGFDFEEFADEVNLRKARDLSKQQLNYRSI